MSDILFDIAGRCDGVRCDMAMLLINDVFCNTWGGNLTTPRVEFWPEAIFMAKTRNPNLLMIAEVYWNLEYTLQQQGFDYTYDKVLYDRLSQENVEPLRMHLQANFAFQRHLARFIENHDEERAMNLFGPERNAAVSTLAMTLPGLHIFHEGQLNGAKLKLPIQLGRRFQETPDSTIESFYKKLLCALRDPVFHNGTWLLLKPRKEWDKNGSYRNILAHQWIKNDDKRLVVANLSPQPAQCFLPLEMPSLSGHSWILPDLLSDTRYIRRGDDMLKKGLYLDLPPWGHHLFTFQISSS